MCAMPPGATPTSVNRTVRAGLYLRASEAKSLKAGAGATAWREIGEEVKAQQGELSDMAAQLGWQVAKVYNDNDIPASKPTVARPGFERMLSDLESGVINAILFYRADRLARLVYDAARVIRLFELDPDLKGLSHSGGVDLSTPEGRAMFMTQAAMGDMEVASNRRRTIRKNKRLAEQGVMHGAPRPFGWAEDRIALHPQESKDLAAAIRAVPRGKKVGTIRKEWYEKGYTRKPTKKGLEKHGNRALPMDHATVEQTLINPRNCGYMVYIPASERQNAKKKLWLPDYVVYKDGKPVMGPWEPVVTPEEWAACVETIKERKERRKKGLNKPHETSEKYLLAGIARCGKCLSPMVANEYQRGTPSYERYGYRYTCLSRLGGCGGVSRVGPPVEDLVVSAFLEEVRRTLEGKAAPVDEVDVTVHDERLAEIEKELEEVNQRRRYKRISTSMALDLIEELERERDQLQAERRKLQASKVTRKTEYPTLLKEWELYTVGEKKERLKRDIKAVIIHPQGRGRQPFNPDLIEIEWAS